jgi:hypothetical protein
MVGLLFMAMPGLYDIPAATGDVYLAEFTEMGRIGPQYLRNISSVVGVPRQGNLLHSLDHLALLPLAELEWFSKRDCILTETDAIIQSRWLIRPQVLQILRKN